MPKKVFLPMFDVRAQFQPATVNKEARTAELVWSTGARVLRSSFWDGPYFEELSMDAGAIRMERLNMGAPLLNAHNARDLASQIGVVERAWLENGQGKAIVRFSQNNPAADSIWKDVADGIIRNVSVGYITHKFEQVEGGADTTPVMRAVDWEPMELSLVPIPADMHSGVRAGETEKFECQFITRNFKGEKTAMTEQQLKELAEKNQREKEAAEKAASEAATKRAADILSAVRKAGLDQELAEEMIASTSTVDECRSQIIDKIAERTPAIDPRNPSVTIVTSDVDTMKRGMESALLHRFDAKKYPLAENGREFVGMSLRELAKEALEKRGAKIRGLSVSEIATRAFHSTSDFPEILANVANKSLRDGYEEAPATYAPIVREVEVADFKQISRTQLGDYPELEKVNELGEFKRGTVSEAAEKYQVETYGKVVAVSRQVIVNDDMAAFTRLPMMAGIAARNKISNLVWAIITGNPVMGDGVALFHATHSNLQTGAAAIKDGLSAMRSAMKKQTGLDGQLLNIMPKFLLVGSERETEAESLVSSLIIPNTVSDSIPLAFARSLQVIAEPRLGAVPYYVAASIGQVDVIELAYLQGQRGVFLETRMGFDVDGMELKARLDFGVKAIDHRGLQKNPGV
jgi:hypothetical protein